MARIFWIYAVWHIAILLFQFEVFVWPVGYGKLFMCIVLLNMMYICFMPFYKVMNSVKWDNTDTLYVNICLAMIPSRFLTMTIGTLFGSDSVFTIMACELFALPCYIVYKKYFIDRVSQSKWFDATNERDEY